MIKVDFAGRDPLIDSRQGPLLAVFQYVLDHAEERQRQSPAFLSRLRLDMRIATQEPAG
jgi:hypothetical protein